MRLLPCFLIAAFVFAEDRIREDFREVPAHIPATSEDLTCDQLTLRRLGPGADQLKLSFHPNVKDDPHYLWLRCKNYGDSRLYLAVRTAAGWFADSAGIGANKTWTEHGLAIANIAWKSLAPDTVQLADSATPDLSKVLSVAFAAPLKPKGSKDCVRLDWFEISP